jgi:predicted Fe-Mo cluster-binding NifX family protein
MRICVPTIDDQGLEARPNDHFGSAPYFTLVDTETDEVRVIANPGAQHEHGQCRPLRWLTPEGLDAVVCRGMGRRALANLKREGIDVFISPRPYVSQAVNAVLQGEATRLTSVDACHGGHGHGRRGPGCGND